MLKTALTTLIHHNRHRHWRIEQLPETFPLIGRWHTEGWRTYERRLFAQFIHDGDLVFDIGANHGETVREYRTLGARVIAVEPDPRNVRALRTAFRFDPAVTLVAAGAGAQLGAMPFYVGASDARSTFAIEAARHLDGAAFAADAPMIRVTTLDHLIAEFGVPHFIKIDVEGFEPHVLTGLSRCVPALCFEFHKELRAEWSACLDRLVSLGMTRFNLRLYAVGGARPYHRLDRLYYDTPVSRATISAQIDDIARTHALAGDIFAFL